jgi:hypothetical protein
MGSFFGKGLHYSHIVNAEHLCGKFNGIVRTSILIVLDECLFPGNHTHASVLKSLLHDEQKLLRQLYKDAVMIPCYDHIIINSNDSFSVKAEKDDRSYAILSVSNKNQGHSKYWDSIYHEISRGGREAFLHHLLQMDISDFRPEDMPVSLDSSRWTMKVHSLSPVDTFLLQILKKPKRFGSVLPMFIPSTGTKFGLVIDVKLLWDSFCLTNSSSKHHRPETFISQVLNSFQSGKHSSTPEDNQVISKDYRHGTCRSRGTHLGIICKSFDEGIEKLRRAFSDGCRSPVSIVFPSESKLFLLLDLFDHVFITFIFEIEIIKIV